jgi:Tol biopolymer transport system component
MIRQVRILLLFLAFITVLVAIAFCVQEGSVPEAARTGLPFLFSTTLPGVKEALEGIPATLLPENPEMDEISIYPTSSLPQTSVSTLAPTELPPQNGRVIFLGLDGKIYSLDPVGGDPALLGESADFHIFPGPRWYSKNGDYVLVLKTENGRSQIHLAPANATGPSVNLGDYSEGGDLSSPQIRFQFSPDDRYVLFVESSQDNASDSTIRLVNLDAKSVIEHHFTSPVASLNTASFLGGGERIVILEEDPASKEPYLVLYELQPSGLLQISRLAAFPGRQLVQFSVSPDGLWIAGILSDPAGMQSLYLLNMQHNEARELLPGLDQKILIAEPAWIENGLWLMVNRWWNENGLIYEYLAFNTQSEIVQNLYDEPALSEGSPVSFIFTIAPDDQAVVFSKFDPIMEISSEWLVVLGGEYKRKLAESQTVNSISQGEVIADLDRTWTNMLIYSSEPGLPLGKLYRTTLDDRDRILLGENVPYPFYSIGPVISPDGVMAAYYHLGDGGLEAEFGQVSVISLDGSDRRVLLYGNPAEEKMVGIPLVWLEIAP